MKQDLPAILKEYWGYDAFRPLQEDIIRSVLSGTDTLALLPTGGGKSICYQVPAMAMEGLCLVISPLIALMKDQVEGLRKRNITALSVFSGMKRKEVINTFEVASQSNCKFLFVSPERLETSLFHEYMPALGITMIAVDEAHCISQWGYDFRPPYTRIASIRAELPGVPVLALTASATEEVQQDICDKLSLEKHEWKIFRQSFERPNLSYSLFKVPSKINRISEILKNVPGTAVVYCKSRKRTKEISDLLNMHGFSSDFYHAGLTTEERNKKQDAWLTDQTRIIVSTNAFGMGIDKPQVRCVVHADVPDCLENYYQEAGRAGRDGKKAYAVLLYDDTDINELHQQESTRFPEIKDIREVYKAIVNFLQVPEGDGANSYFDFPLQKFLLAFPLSPQVVVNSMKVLEQDGWLSFNEQVFLPSTVMVNAGRERLKEIELINSFAFELVRTMLRAYGGIMDQHVRISENSIAWLMKKTVAEIEEGLQWLHSSKVIVYDKQKDCPQVFFIRPRVKAEDLTIDMIAYERRKQKYSERLKSMLDYVDLDNQCRSSFIGEYFGDVKMKDCGICDNCLKRKQTNLSNEEFDTIHHRIINVVKYENISVEEISYRLRDIGKEKLWKVISFLQSEGKIKAGKNGRLELV